MFHPAYPSVGPIGRIKLVRARFAYDASAPDEISFLFGDVFEVTSKDQGNGWWLGVHSGKAGLFPSSYVEAIN